MSEEPKLEGFLIKQGTKRKKAWKKRLFRRVENDELHYFQGKNQKGNIDLKMLLRVNVVEEQVKHDSTQYFIFELELIGGNNERLGASDRLQLQYWLDVLNEILVRRGNQVSTMRTVFLFFKTPCACFVSSFIGSLRLRNRVNPLRAVLSRTLWMSEAVFDF